MLQADIAVCHPFVPTLSQTAAPGYFDAGQSYPMVEAVRKILPQIHANAEKAEVLRHVPPENIQLLEDIGLFRAFQPKCYGGLEITLPEFCQAITLLATACASTAWASSLLATHSHQLAMFPKETQDLVWKATPEARLSSSIAPMGKVTEVPGGIRLSGQYGWSSGCDYADWVILGANRFDDAGNKHYSFCVVPRRDYSILDDWYTMGMKGSGSKTIVVEDLFIPEARIQTALSMMTGKSAGFGLYPDSPIFYSPYRPYFASGFSCVSLGIAERMLHAFREKNRHRIRAYTGASVGTATPALMRLAESTQQVAAARALLEKMWEEHRAYSARHEYPTRETITNWRTNQAYAVKMCIASVDRLFAAAGGSVFFDGNEINRLFRDSHITGAHAYTDYDVCAQILGREIMGLEPDPSLL